MMEGGGGSEVFESDYSIAIGWSSHEQVLEIRSRWVGRYGVFVAIENTQGLNRHFKSQVVDQSCRD